MEGVRLPFLLMCLALLSQGPSAHAQQGGPYGQPDAQQGRPPGSHAPEQGPPAVQPHQLPIFAVSAAEVTQSGTVTVIRVRGVTTTVGWRDATLVPLVRGTPSDGVLDVVVVAEPPQEAMPAAGFAPVEAVLLVEQNHPYRGVRVRSATNVVAVGKLPGKSEAVVPAEDCHACVGRMIGAGGEAIARDTLPRSTRVIGPADPFPDVQPNPNRLTLLVGDDGKVIEAVWQ